MTDRSTNRPQRRSSPDPQENGQTPLPPVPPPAWHLPDTPPARPTPGAMPPQYAGDALIPGPRTPTPPDDPAPAEPRRGRGWFAPRPTLRAGDQYRNMIVGVGVAALTGFADALLLPSVVIAAFVVRVSGSYLLVAFVPVVAALAWALPGAVAGSTIANRVRAMPLAAGSAAVRALAMGVLAVITAGQVDGTARALLTSFFGLYAAVTVLGGFTALAGERLPGRVTDNQTRGRFVRWRAIAASGAAIIAALVMRRILTNGAASFPREYLFFFFLAFLVLLVVACLIPFFAERAMFVSVAPRPPFGGLRAAPDLLRLPAYRRYLLFRIIALLATVAEPFFIVYALQTLRASEAMVGGYIVAVTLTRVLSMYLWRSIARLTGTKLVLQLGALLRTLAAAAVIVLPVIWDLDPIASRLTGDEPRARLFLFAFVCIGAAMGANAVAQGGLLLDTLPPVAYADGVAFTNGVLAVCSVALIAGGFIAERRGLRDLFVIALALGLLTVFLGGILREPRRPLRRSGSLGPGIRRTEAFSTLRPQTDSFPTIPPYRR